MSLIPRNRLFDVDSFFEPEMFSGLWPSRNHAGDMATLNPRVDVKEKDNAYEITAELPGVKKEDISVSLNNGVLSLKAETKQENTEEENGKVIRQERRYGSYIRSFDVGSQVQESDIHADFNNGVLRVVAPKLSETQSEAKKNLHQLIFNRQASSSFD